MTVVIVVRSNCKIVEFLCSVRISLTFRKRAALIFKNKMLAA